MTFLAEPWFLGVYFLIYAFCFFLRYCFGVVFSAYVGGSEILV